MPFACDCIQHTNKHLFIKVYVPYDLNVEAYTAYSQTHNKNM